MSANYSSVQIRMDDRESVMRVIEEISRKQKQKLLVGPALGDWIGVYPKWCDYTKLCRAIARRLNPELLSLEIKYDDVFLYEYYRETDPRSQSHRNQASERAWETLAGWPSNSGITPPYAADRESRLPSRCPILWDQNSAFPGVRGNGITSRILTIPVT